MLRRGLHRNSAFGKGIELPKQGFDIGAGPIGQFHPPTAVFTTQAFVDLIHQTAVLKIQVKKMMGAPDPLAPAQLRIGYRRHDS